MKSCLVKLREEITKIKLITTKVISDPSSKGSDFRASRANGLFNRKENATMLVPPSTWTNTGLFCTVAQCYTKAKENNSRNFLLFSSLQLFKAPRGRAMDEKAPPGHS